MYRHLLSLLLLVSEASPGAANDHVICRVNDQTGTPLNVRGKPDGFVLGTVANGIWLEAVGQALDTGCSVRCELGCTAPLERLGI